MVIDLKLSISGVTKESDISGPDASDIVPDYVMQSIGDLRE
jgi:4-nitrophenyl phosphatase